MEGLDSTGNHGQGRCRRSVPPQRTDSDSDEDFLASARRFFARQKKREEETTTAAAAATGGGPKVEPRPGSRREKEEAAATDGGGSVRNDRRPAPDDDDDSDEEFFGLRKKRRRMQQQRAEEFPKGDRSAKEEGRKHTKDDEKKCRRSTTPALSKETNGDDSSSRDKSVVGGDGGGGGTDFGMGGRVLLRPPGLTEPAPNAPQQRNARDRIVSMASTTQSAAETSVVVCQRPSDGTPSAALQTKSDEAASSPNLAQRNKANITTAGSSSPLADNFSLSSRRKTTLERWLKPSDAGEASPARKRPRVDGDGGARTNRRPASAVNARSPGKVERKEVVDLCDSDSDDGINTVRVKTSAPVNSRRVESAESKNNVVEASKQRTEERPSKSSSEAPPSALRVDGSGGDSEAKTTTDGDAVPDAIVGRSVPTPRNVRWTVCRDSMLVRTTIPAEPSRTLVAAFDLDQTLVLWRCAGWPSQPSHYELWSASVPDRLRKMHDEGYKIVLFSNQGGIRRAFNGKNATRVKAVIDWLASLIDRPVHAVCSTRKDGGYHKPDPGMWTTAEERCNGGVQFEVKASFYVGDSASQEEGDPDDPQGGVDRRFAENIGSMRGATLPFETPVQWFGPSDADRRRAVRTMEEYEEPPESALRARAALLGGYLCGPLLLILCGVQGSGKSTFCQNLLSGGSENWVHLSQDTIRRGRPGKRKEVEDAALSALRDGKSVVVDRMHLDGEQREHFVAVAKMVSVPCHVIVLNPPKEVLERRVRDRKDHPGGVQGKNGVRLALSSLSKMVQPTYGEGFELISCVSTDAGSSGLFERYRSISRRIIPGVEPLTASAFPSRAKAVPFALGHNDGSKLPPIAVGTMGMGKRVAEVTVAAAIRSGLRAFDTAPTYKNEEEVGRAISSSEGCFAIVKVPKRAVSAAAARDEVLGSLRRLRRTTVDLLLLHWPCDLIEADTLGSVWKELEKMKSEGICHFLGVSNFSVGALRTLLPLCSVRPVVNQVERHPLLPQWDLVDFCKTQNVVLQSHTSLAHGRDDLLRHPILVNVSRETGLSTAQVLLKWNLQHGVAVVVKCSSDEHQQQAASLLVTETNILSAEQMKALDLIGYAAPAPLRFVDPPFMRKRGAPYSWG